MADGRDQSHLRTPAPLRQKVGLEVASAVEDGKTCTAMGCMLDEATTDPRTRVEACIKRKRQELSQQQQEVLPALQLKHVRLEEEIQRLKRPWHTHDRQDREDELASVKQKIARMLTQEDKHKFEEDAREVLSALADTTVPSLPQAPVFVNARYATKKDGASRRRQTPKPVCFTVREHQPEAANHDGNGDDDNDDDDNADEGRSTKSRKRPFREVLADDFLDAYDTERERQWVYSLSEDACGRCGGVLCHDTSKDTFVCENPRCRKEKKCVSGVTTTMNQQMLKGDRYRRAAYFRAHLLKLQGLFTSPVVTEKVIRKIKRHLIRIMKVRRIHSSTVQTALEAMDEAYADWSPTNPKFWKDLVQFKTYITAKITGVKPPTFTPQQLTILDRLFAKISTAFDELRQEGIILRKNMISYFLAIYKCLELVGDWGKPFLRHFRSSCWPEKTARQDKEWKKICARAGLTYIKTA